ncbi:hypothetical protein HYPSUDRAFT_200660 [Hypholoma sublateritium FD-334 SS-4]|uniref:Uncharacterized protein n=1 Tax=Hypholoma sublateritium (strain FD-334 SS-4) TaxID=945553 RepID=A0A0D2P0J8_HYPSF|nr:hypothetical protein HYPSUDRAFT_200660 [Hypholoma sublateritium FD-334 SS-4]
MPSAFLPRHARSPALPLERPSIPATPTAAEFLPLTETHAPLTELHYAPSRVCATVAGPSSFKSERGLELRSDCSFALSHRAHRTARRLLLWTAACVPTRCSLSWTANEHVDADTSWTPTPRTSTHQRGPSNSTLLDALHRSLTQTSRRVQPNTPPRTHHRIRQATRVLRVWSTAFITLDLCPSADGPWGMRYVEIALWSSIAEATPRFQPCAGWGGVALSFTLSLPLTQFIRGAYT